MIKNFLMINCIGKDDRLALSVNKDFFVYNLNNNQRANYNLVNEIFNFLSIHNVKVDEKFNVIINQGPGSFSAVRIALAIAKGLIISKKVNLYGYKNTDLKSFDQENIEKLLKKRLIEKKLIKPIYLS